MEGTDMASTRTRVTPQELRRRADELDNLNATFKTEVSGLRDDEAQLAANYKGDAQTKFHARFMADLEKFGVFSAAIQRYAEQLRADADRYDAAEARNVAIAQTNR